MTSSSTPGQHEHHAAVRARPQHRRRRAGRAGGDRRRAARSCRRTMPTPPSFRKVEPGRLADPASSRCTSKTLPLSHGRRVRRDDARAALSMVDGVAQVQRVRRAEVRGAHPGSIRTRSRRAASASTRSPARSATANVEPADRHAERPDADVAIIHADGQLTNAAAFRRQIVAYRNGAPVRLERGRARRSTASRTTASADWYNGERAHRPSRSSGSRAPTRSRSSTRSSSVLPQFEAQLPPSVAADDPLRPQPRRSASRSTTCSSRC